MEEMLRPQDEEDKTKEQLGSDWQGIPPHPLLKFCCVQLPADSPKEDILTPPSEWKKYCAP